MIYFICNNLATERKKNMMNLSSLEIHDIIDRLQHNESIPEDYKYKLFPTKEKEYELVYAGKMRKEDVLSYEDGVFPVPLQVEKVFQDNNYDINGNWSNMLVFGDNLQFLKTINENVDPLIKDKVKGKIKLIYIDPPFATENDFKSSKGQQAFGDKVKGSEFIEHLRRRLIVAKEVLAPDGSIFVHLDSKKVHYIKVVMDEIFGEGYFKNELVWCYRGMAVSENHFVRRHDTILFYSNGDNSTFEWKEVAEPLEESTIKKYKHVDKNGRKFRLHGRNIQGSPIQNNTDVDIKWLETNPELCRVDYLDEKIGSKPRDWFIMDYINIMSKERTGYPTQKPEKVLERIIRVVTKPGDIVLDFFAGSGTSIAVAEKLGRKWIACDIGKLSIYTIQKRLLQIKSSKDLNNDKKRYGKEARRFLAINTGQYDLEKIFSLREQEYKKFVLNLFEVEPLNKKINGVKIDGQKKDGYYCMVFPYWKFKDASVDEEFLNDLHSNIGKRIRRRFYIIAPVNYVDFFSDYYEIDDVRYYFLKVPYHIIRELHKVDFKKIRQPQSKGNINNLEDAIGFQFMRTPHVESSLSLDDSKVHINILKFRSDYEDEETGTEMENFESLSLVLIDKNYNDNEFIMDEYYFASDLLNFKDKKKVQEDEEEKIEYEFGIKEKLKSKQLISLPSINRNECGNKIMIIYIDIYGNEFREILEVKNDSRDKNI